MRKVTQKGLNLIKRFEKFEASPYRCQGGFLTIGYGHVIRSFDNFTYPMEEEVALNVLAKDVEGAGRSVLRLIKVFLFAPQFDALVSFTFNVGGGALQSSTLRMKLNRGDFDIQGEFLRWVWTGGRWSKGLYNRRVIEANLFCL